MAALALYPYKGTAALGLWRRLRVLAVPVAAVTLALSAGGCSFSYQLGSLFEKNEPRSEYTASVNPRRETSPDAVGLPPESDLAYARAVAAELLATEGQTRSAPWENPRTGARGTVTPFAVSYTQDGLLCRDFLASYVRQGNETWLQGEACRLAQGKWEVRHLRAWNRS